MISKLYLIILYFALLAFQFSIQYDNSRCATLPNFMGVSRGLSRIVNGKDADKPIPWQITMFYRRKKRCGANLIDQTTILTAAHCCEFVFPNGSSTRRRDGTYQLDFEPDRYSFKVGSLIAYNEEYFPIVHIQAFKVIVHPNFIMRNHSNDIAIIKIRWKDRIEYDENKRPACLPTSFSFDNIVNKDCYISGWGTTEIKDMPRKKRQMEMDINEFPIILQWGKIKIREPGDCKETVFSDDIINVHEVEAFCAGSDAKPLINSCYGDSGGPLVCVENQTVVLTGIVSYGTMGCGKYPVPSIYTKVFGFLQWILPFTETKPYTPRPNCEVPILFGDGQCTDENNVEECEFDGGDCCIRGKSHEEMKLIYRFCTNCLCLDESSPYFSTRFVKRKDELRRSMLN